MKQILWICAVVALVGCGKAKPTPDAAANKLFVEAVQLISSAEEQTGEPAIKDYEQALAHLQNIISDYSESDLAVKLISGETLFTGKSLKEIKERVKELKELPARRAAEAKAARAVAEAKAKAATEAYAKAAAEARAKERKAAAEARAKERMAIFLPLGSRKSSIRNWMPPVRI